MPITVKFSQQFYDTLGHEVTDELVDWFNRADAHYRTDLMRINDLNYDRFDSKIGQRFEVFEARMNQRFEVFQARVDQRFEVFEALMEHRYAEQDTKWEKRFAEQDAKWEKRFAEQDAKWETRFAEQDAKWEKRIHSVETRVESIRADLIKWMFVFWATSTLTMIGVGFALVRVLA